MQNTYHFRQKLLEEKEKLEQSVKIIQEQLQDRFTESTGELSAYDQHTGDAGAEMFERGKDIALMENEEIILGKVSEALDRIDEGTYGTCERCGKPIDPGRLEAIPYASLCVECKEETEEPEDRMVRPVEEDIFDPAFATTFKDGDDYIGFDGEDAWQAVARWGTANSPQDVPDAVVSDEAYINADERIGAVTDLEAIPYPEDDKAGGPGNIYPDPSTGRRRKPYRQPFRGTRV